MNITIIGTGNVATVLGKLFLQNNHTIVEVIGRSEAAAKELSDALKCSYSLNFKTIYQHSDLYVIAVSDKAVAQLANEIIIPKESTMVHTAGGVSKDVFRNNIVNYGVLYPLQSLRKGNHHLPEIPFFIDANSEATKNVLYDFAKTISDKIFFANDEMRLKLHVAAVFTSNFPNFLYTIANDFCEKENLDFKNLLPLINETVNRLKYFSPSEMQTGPAIRKDGATIQKHLNALLNDEIGSAVYSFLSQQIMHYFD